MALLKYTGDIDLSRNGILDILKIQGPDFYEGLSNNLEITTKDETGEESGSLILRSGSSNTTVGNVYLFAGSYTDLSKIKVKGITLTTSKILLNHDKVETTTNTLVRTIADGGTTEFVEEIYSAEENNKTKGYSATANTKYDITSNNSTALKNKKLTIIAGKDGATSTVDGVKKDSGYYTLYVPATDTGLSEEYIDEVNVRNLFSQTAGDFKLGDNNTAGSPSSRIDSIILNGSMLSSDLKTSANLTSPKIEIKANNSSIKSTGEEETGRLYITSPNGFSLEVDNTNSDASKHVSKLTIKDIEATNSTTAKGIIDLGDSTNGATISVPKSLTVNAVEFTLNQVDSNNNVVDNSLTSEGSAILTSELGTNNKDTATFGKRIASLNVENATINTELTSSNESDLEGTVNINTSTGKITGNLTVIGKAAKIQSSEITLGTNDTTTSSLTTYIGTQASNISELTENISGDSTRNFQKDNVKEEFIASTADKTSSYSITSKVPLAIQSSGTAASITISSIDSDNKKSSLTIKGPGYTLEAPNSTTGEAKETVDNLSVKNTFALTENNSTFSIGDSSSNKKASSITTYSASTTRTNETLTESAGTVEDYKYSLKVNKNSSELSIRDASFGNKVSIGNILNLNNSTSGFNVNALGKTTLNLSGNFDLKGAEAETSILSSSVVDGNRTTAINTNSIKVAESLTSESESTLTGTSATIDAGTVNIGTEGTTLTVNATENTESIKTQTSTYSESLTREVRPKDSLVTYTEKIETAVDSNDESKLNSKKGFTATSNTLYTLTANNAFTLNAGKKDSYPLIIETSESRTDGGYDQASIKTTTLNATSSLETPIVNIGNYATVKNHVDLGDIRIKYDSSSQSLIFGAV